MALAGLATVGLSISGAGALPVFTSWIVFFVVFGVAQAVQTMGNRVSDDA